MIYFARIGEDGPIKIGTTIHVRTRMRELENKHGVPLDLLAVRDGGRKAERQHHVKFSHLRIGLTEEFEPADDLLEYIRQECRVPGPHDLEREPAAPPVRTDLIVFPSTAAFRDWVKQLAKSEDRTVAVVFTRAITEYAERAKFEPPPER